MRLELFRTQFIIRQAEQRAYDLFLQNLVKGTSHLSLGQEAVAAGFARRHAPGRSELLHLSRPCPHARARRAGRESARRAHAARQRADARQGRVDAPHLRRARRDGLLRDHRRASADRLRRRLARAVQGARRRLRLLLRRRHHQYRRLPRGAEFRRGVEAAGRLRLREQSLHGIHADPQRHRGRASRRRPRRRLRPRADRHRRQRRRRGLSHGADRLRAGARRQGPVAHRMHDLPAQRPFARRPGKIPAGRRAGGMAEARSDPALPRTAEAVRRQRGRHRRDRSGGEADRRRGDRGLQGRADADRPRSSPPTSMPMEAGHGGTDLSRRGRPRHRAGDGARRRRRLPRRGRGGGGRRLQGDRRAPRKVRADPRARLPDLGAGDPRRRDGRGDDRPEADRRDHVLRLLRGLLRLHRQRIPEEPLHVERAAQMPARRAHRQRRRLALRRAAQPERRELVR